MIRALAIALAVSLALNVGLGWRLWHGSVQHAVEATTCAQTNTGNQAVVEALQQRLDQCTADRAAAERAREAASAQREADRQAIEALRAQREQRVRDAYESDATCAAWARRAVCPVAGNGMQ